MMIGRDRVRTRPWWRGVAVAAVCVGATGTILATPSATASVPVEHRRPSGDDRVAVYVDAGAAADLQAAGGTMIADYGAYALWRVPPSTAVGREGVTVAGDLDKIELRDTAINTADDVEPSVASDLRDAAGRNGKELRLVQFAGPIKPEWVDGLRKSGLKIVSYLPPNGYIVLGDASAVQALVTRAASDQLISFEGPFRPAYRLEPALAERRDDGGTVDVVVQVVAGETADLAAVKTLGKTVKSRVVA